MTRTLLSAVVSAMPGLPWAEPSPSSQTSVSLLLLPADIRTILSDPESDLSRQSGNPEYGQITVGQLFGD